VKRKSERELVVTRTFNGPARIVFQAWTKPELLKRWWAPKSTGVSLLSCEADIRVGGRYRFEFGHEASTPGATESRLFFRKLPLLLSIAAAGKGSLAAPTTTEPAWQLDPQEQTRAG
jgi:hypothetical protein